MRLDDTPTPAELRVLRALAEHGSVDAAAAALNLSPHTVTAHLDHLRDRTGLRKTSQLLLWAARNGWLVNKPDEE